MATLTITVSNDAGEVLENMTMSEASMGRFLAWALAAYPTHEVITPSEDLEGSDAITQEPNTPVQAVKEALRATLAGLKNNVLNYEKNSAYAALIAPSNLD